MWNKNGMGKTRNKRDGKEKAWESKIIRFMAYVTYGHYIIEYFRIKRPAELIFLPNIEVRKV